MEALAVLHKTLMHKNLKPLMFVIRSVQEPVLGKPRKWALVDALICWVCSLVQLEFWYHVD